MTSHLKKILIISFFSCFIFSSSVLAWRGLEVRQKNDDTVRMNLTDDLKLSFTATHLIAKSGIYDLEIPLSEVSGFNFSHDVVDIMSRISDSKIVDEISFSKAFIRFSKLSDVKIYNLKGTMIFSEPKCEYIDMSQFQTGVYLVNVNGFTFKFKN